MSKHTPSGLESATNPFIVGLSIPVFLKTKYESRVDPSKIKISDGTVTSVGHIDTIKKSFVLEKDRSVTIYLENNGVSLKEDFVNISKEGRLLLDYIMLYCLRENRLYCYIDAVEFMNIYNIASRTTFWRSKKNLIDFGFISPTSYQGWFWINPKYFYRGSRTRTPELELNLTTKKEDIK